MVDALVILGSPFSPIFKGFGVYGEVGDLWSLREYDLVRCSIRSLLVIQVARDEPFVGTGEETLWRANLGVSTGSETEESSVGRVFCELGR